MYFCWNYTELIQSVQLLCYFLYQYLFSNLLIFNIYFCGFQNADSHVFNQGNNVYICKTTDADFLNKINSTKNLIFNPLICK